MVKQYTWKIVKIVTRPLESLKPKKNLQNRNSTYNSPTPNPQDSKKAEDSSNNPSDHPNQVEILATCANAGIYYDPERPGEIFRYPLEEVKAAVEFYESRIGYGEPIKNPAGWLISCLRWKWYDQSGVVQRLAMFFDDCRPCSPTGNA